MQAQGTYGQILTLMEPSFKTAPTPASPRARKLYIKSEGFGYNQDLIASQLLRGGNRQPTSPVRGNTDVSGTIETELNALTMLFHAACGDMDSTVSGGTFTSIGTVSSASISGQFMTVTFSAAHGLTGSDIGLAVQIAGATGVWATPLNTKVYALVEIPTTPANSIILRVQAGLTAGTVTGTITASKFTSGSPVYTHTIRAGGNLASYILEKGFVDIGQYFRYSGCKCGSLKFDLAAAGMLNLSAGWMGAGEAISGTPIDAAPTDPGKASFDGLGIATANFKLDGAVIAVNTPKTFSLSLDNALDGDTYIIGGQGVRGAINAGVLGVSGSFAGIFENSGVSGSGAGYDLYAKAKAGTPIAWDVTAIRGSGSGTSGNESLQVNLGECLMKPQAPQIGPGGIMLKADYQAFVNSGTEAVKFVIKNAIGPGLMV